jgi:hypothetical protein
MRRAESQEHLRADSSILTLIRLPARLPNGAWSRSPAQPQTLREPTRDRTDYRVTLRIDPDDAKLGTKRHVSRETTLG